MKGDDFINYVDIDITDRKVIKSGMYVDITTEKNEVKRGYIKQILTRENNNKPLKVELTDGNTGRILGVPSKIDLEKENFKFYNLFLNESHICALYDRKEDQCYMSKTETPSGVKSTIYLFSDSREAKELLKGSKFDNKNYYIRPIKRTDYIVKLYISDYYVIDLKKKISMENLEIMERKFY